jgi:hypothetical protein
LRTLLKGQALSYFEHHLRKRLDAEDSELPDSDLLELVIRDVGLEYIPRSAKEAPEWHAAMVAANIDIFSMSYEESVS